MKTKDNGILLISLYHLIVGALTGIGVCAVLSLPVLLALLIAGEPSSRNVLLVVSIIAVLSAVLFLVAAVANLLVGWGLLQEAEWARVGAIALAIFRLLNFPIGTLVGALVIWYLIQPRVTDLFRRAKEASP